MNFLNFLDYGIKIFGFKLFRQFGYPKMMPENVVFSVTNLCNSKCLTCSIWEKYQKYPSLAKKELTTNEWIKTWQGIGKITYTTFTGGEPFLRPDVLKLLIGLYVNCQPKILNIPHNGTMPNRFGKILEEFLKRTNKKTSITVNLSLDGIGKDHDKIRGFPGNWQRLIKTIKIIKKLQKKYPNLNLGIHTVVSKWNIKKIPEISNYVIKNFKPDSFIMEPAEERYELGTIGWRIMPSKKELGEVFRVYTSGKNHTPLINLVRRIYIDKYIKGRGLPCYAGFNHCQITANGNVWVCCMVADSQPMGNLKDANFDFKKIWFSVKADKLREKVKTKDFKECEGCYLACAANTSIPQNILLTGKYFLKELVGR